MWIRSGEPGRTYLLLLTPVRTAVLPRPTAEGKRGFRAEVAFLVWWSCKVRFSRVCWCREDYTERRENNQTPVHESHPILHNITGVHVINTPQGIRQHHWARDSSLDLSVASYHARRHESNHHNASTCYLVCSLHRTAVDLTVQQALEGAWDDAPGVTMATMAGGGAQWRPHSSLPATSSTHPTRQTLYPQPCSKNYCITSPKLTYFKDLLDLKLFENDVNRR